MCVHKITDRPDNLDGLDGLDKLELETGTYKDNCDYITLENVVPACDKDLTILQINIRGIQSKINELKFLIDHCYQNTTPDIILLCETWLTPNSPQVTIAGYKFFHRDQLGKRAGGVGILVSEKLQSRERDQQLTIQEFESCFVDIKMGKLEFIIGSCYRPRNMDIRKFIKNYRNLLRVLRKTKGKHIILGMDHNIDLLKTATHTSTQNFLETNLKEGMYPTITRPTRVTKTTATLLDNIFLNEELHSDDASHILLDNISDHFPCSVVLKNIHRNLKEGLEIESRNLKFLPRLIEELQNIDWSFLNTNDLGESEKFDRFHDTIVEKIDHFVPITSKHIAYHKIWKEPWVSPGLLVSMKKEKRLYKNTLGKNISNEALVKYHIETTMLY